MILNQIAEFDNHFKSTLPARHGTIPQSNVSEQDQSGNRIWIDKADDIEYLMPEYNQQEKA